MIELNGGFLSPKLPKYWGLIVQKKQTFESVLRECGFEFRPGFNHWYLIKGIRSYIVYVFMDGKSCDITFNNASFTVGRIKSPERLKVLIDILLETR